MSPLHQATLELGEEVRPIEDIAADHRVARAAEHGARLRLGRAVVEGLATEVWQDARYSNG
jgi:hypothetical protein